MPETSNSNTRKGPASSRARFALPGCVLAAIATALLLGGCGGSTEPGGETIRLVIPAGTSAALEAGRPAKAIPDRIDARVGDTLVVENRDRATQFVSGFAVSPGQTMKIPLSREGTYMTNCSAHRDRSIKMVVKA